MKKLASLLTAALFTLSAAAPAGATPASVVQDDDRMLLVPVPPAPEVAKPVKAQKHKRVKKAKHQPARIKKHRK
jgi:hypothetical protein